MVIDHIGIVVRSLEDGIQQWESSFGYSRRSDIVMNARQQVRVVFLATEGSVIVKLVEPVGPESAVFAFARRGGGLHHLCFRCEKLDEGISKLKGDGALCLKLPEPGEAFNNNKIAFMLARNNLNIELVDSSEKTGWSE